eukprot:GHRQ01039980.1.p1 GENE.GHRQ01039980.1~~GHRQ01039980.1.p1  ORF type:complete len:163 (-),score=48.07 GHRQ01039980.1:127-615(-)
MPVLQASTGLSLKATAGLRLLPGSKADDILAAVRKFLATHPFKLKSDAVEIMDGAHEGAFAWLTLNYLLGRLDSGATGTVAAIDLGGGSVQEAFALPDLEATSAPAGYITQLKAGGATYNVYVHRCDARAQGVQGSCLYVRVLATRRWRCGLVWFVGRAVES